MAIAARTREGSSFTLLGDERLARLAAAGHERAFAVVYQRYHQPLYRYCRSILRNDADAQDALQSTFAAAFAALGRGQRDAPIRPWLFRIAYNEAVSALRRRRPTAELSAASGACTTSTEDRVAERAELRMLLRDLHKLSERQRSALVMRELSGLSHEEIAIALGTSVGTAKQTIYEARRSLFEFAEGREMPCDEIRRTISDADGRALRAPPRTRPPARMRGLRRVRGGDLRAQSGAPRARAGAAHRGGGRTARAHRRGRVGPRRGRRPRRACHRHRRQDGGRGADDERPRRDGRRGRRDRGGRRARPGHRSWPRVAQDGARSTRGARATHSTRGPSAQIPGGRAAGPEAGAGQTAHDRGPRRPADGRIHPDVGFVRCGRRPRLERTRGPGREHPPPRRSAPPRLPPQPARPPHRRPQRRPPHPRPTHERARPRRHPVRRRHPPARPRRTPAKTRRHRARPRNPLARAPPRRPQRR